MINHILKLFKEHIVGTYNNTASIKKYNYEHHHDATHCNKPQTCNSQENCAATQTAEKPFIPIECMTNEDWAALDFELEEKFGRVNPKYDPKKCKTLEFILQQIRDDKTKFFKVTNYIQTDEQFQELAISYNPELEFIKLPFLAVETPFSSMSDITDEDWALLDFKLKKDFNLEKSKVLAFVLQQIHHDAENYMKAPDFIRKHYKFDEFATQYNPEVRNILKKALGII